MSFFRRPAATLPKRRRPLRLQTLEARQLMAADDPTGVSRPLGATPLDTAEFFLGRIAVTPVFLESDGSIDQESQDWTPSEIQGVLANVRQAMQWWSDTLANLETQHELEFVFDESWATKPLDIGYEPIDRVSDDYPEYVRAFLGSVGISATGNLDNAMFTFNDRQRAALNADWAFTIFIVDSSDDANGFFPSNGTFQGAFALAGGLYMVLPSMRPVRTIAHETGHLFWAMDEYSGGGTYTERRGVYNTQNLNAWNNPSPGFQQAESIMASDLPLLNAYLDNTSSPITLAQVGWQDSDNDGIFDIVDSPLELSGRGWFDETAGQFRFVGLASATTVMNQNPVGPQSDITINRVRRVEMSVDNGPWQLVSQPNLYVTELDLSLDVPANFTDVALRAIDDRTGIFSNVLSGSRSIPIAPTDAFAAFAFLDNNEDAIRASDEALLENVVFQVRAADGSALPSGQYAVTGQPLEVNVPPTAGMTFGTFGPTFSQQVQVQVDEGRSELTLLQIYDDSLDMWTPRMSDRGGVVVTMASPASQVEVDVVGLRDIAYARVEAYDASGNLITRQTTDLRNDADGQLSMGETQTLRLVDPQNRIASVRILGHASTWIGVSGIRHGVTTTMTSDASGVVSLAGLPDGDYQLSATPTEVIQDFAPQIVSVQSGRAVGGLVAFAATRIDSLRFNTTLAEDVNGDGNVSAVDALQVINDLNRLGSRFLTFAETDGPKVDVNNDGRVSATDALRVINYLNRRDIGEPVVAAQETASKQHDEALLQILDSPATDSPALPPTSLETKVIA